VSHTLFWNYCIAYYLAVRKAEIPTLSCDSEPLQVLFKQTTSRSVNSSRLDPSLSWTLKKPETSDVTSCSILIQRYLGFWWIAPTRSCYTPNTDRFLYKRSKCSWVNLYVHILRDQQSFLPNWNKFILHRHKPFIIELWGQDTSLSWHLNP